MQIVAPRRTVGPKRRPKYSGTLVMREKYRMGSQPNSTRGNQIQSFMYVWLELRP